MISATLHKRLTLAVHTLIVVALALVLAHTVLFFAYPPERLPPSAAGPAAADAPKEVDIDTLVGLHLFGMPPKSAAAEPLAATERLEETSLSLVLVGVFAARDGGGSSALVARNGRRPKLYRVGDRLPGNARLAEVYRDRVVITRGAARELVRFAKTKAMVEAAEAPVAVAGPGATEPQAPAAATVDAVAPVRRAVAPARRIADYVAELTRGPREALAELGMAPAGGKSGHGYRVGALADRPELRHTGLQRGDLILSVNGRPVREAAEDRLQAADLLAEGAARLEIQRGERQLVVTVALDSFD